MRKPKQYQVVVTVDEKVLFEDTNNRKVVNEYLEMVDKALSPVKVQVFQFNGTHYELACEKAKMPKSDRRPIGFCREW